MATVFNKTNKNFSQINNELILDKELSFGARGLMCLMLSRPDSWDFNMKELASNTKESYNKVQSYMKELENRRYVLRIKRGVTGVKGKFEWLYFLNGKSFTDEEITSLSQEYSKNNTSNDDPILRQSLNTTVVNNDDGKNKVYSNTELLSNTKKESNTNIYKGCLPAIKQEIDMLIRTKGLNFSVEELLREAKGDSQLVIQSIKLYGDKGAGYLKDSIKKRYIDNIKQKVKTEVDPKTEFFTKYKKSISVLEVAYNNNKLTGDQLVWAEEILRGEGRM